MTSRALELQRRSSVAKALAVALDAVTAPVRISRRPEGTTIFRIAGREFDVAILQSRALGRVEKAAATLARRRSTGGARTIPLVAVPYMTTAAARICRELGTSWIDLCGNAAIVAPALRVLVSGNPNRFRRVGRPASAFAPKSARVARWLLMHPAKSCTQREIARSTALTEGFVSRIVARLEDDRLVERADAAPVGRSSRSASKRRGPIGVRNAAVLLEAWREEYRFDRHTVLRGHVAARSGDALARLVARTLADRGVAYAATGLSAAWQYCRFGAFRTATFFLATPPSAELLDKLGFRETESGANLWLAVPNDDAVFQGAEIQDDIRCVHPLQAYLDLSGHPERSSEAADRLRTEYLSERSHG